MMDIITNHVPRDIIYGFQLSPKEREDFDYYSDDELDERQFFRYRGSVYDTSEFYPWLTLPKWDGFRSDSFFSGVAIKYVDDFERVVVALVLS